MSVVLASERKTPCSNGLGTPLCARQREGRPRVVPKAIFRQRKVENRVFAPFDELAADRHAKAPEFADQPRGLIADLRNQHEWRAVSDGSRLRELHASMPPQYLNNHLTASVGDGINCDTKHVEELGARIAQSILDLMLSSACCTDQESIAAIAVDEPPIGMPAGRESQVAVRALDY
jgi:hypothetical protein